VSLYLSVSLVQNGHRSGGFV